MTTAVRFQALPPLSPDEYQALEQSILENGVLVAVIVDEHGVVIDGHHRQKIAAEHRLFCPTREVRDLDDAQKRTMALSLNLDRRHLNREQRRALVAESIKADPQLSDREHSRRTGVSPSTAGSVRQDLESEGEVSKLDSRVSGDGRERPSSQPPRPTPEPELPPDDPYESFPNEVSSEDVAVEPDPQRKPRDTPITKSFFTANFELRKAVERVVRLSENDRFKKNKDQISGCHLSDLIRARDAINGVIQQLEG